MNYDRKQEETTLLELHHHEYSLYVTGPARQEMLRKAMSLIGKEAVLSTFKWSKDARLFAKVEDHDEELEGIEDHNLLTSEEIPAIFFENTQYQFEIEFSVVGGVENARLEYPPIKNDRGETVKGDTFMARRQLLQFPLNWQNDIGKSHIKVSYKPSGKEWKSLELHFDVLSTKLDYHRDLKIILNDIEREYTMLSLSFLRRTYHTFATDINSQDTPDLIWWNIFKGVQEEFSRAVAMVIDRPHNRLKPFREPQRADKLKRITPNIENELIEHQSEPGHLYLAERWQLNDDTIENRFTKFALNQITKKFISLSEKIHQKNLNTLPPLYAKELEENKDTLRRLQSSPFLRRVGRFTGLKGENLTLKQATGYSTIYRTWLLLQSTYALHDGIRKMELKEISELYEIWCFIEVKNIVRQLMAKNKGVEIDDIDQLIPLTSTSFGQYDPKMMLQLNKGEQSKIILRQGEISLAEVIYNAQLTGDASTNRKSGIGENIGSATVVQKPDIVLRLTKQDIEKGLEMTYLFDAKYRIDVHGDHQTPPEDAINQMHRYRDAIFYSDTAFQKDKPKDATFKREVLGGYILFPGKEPKNTENYLESIDKVNIGGFPLRPNPNGVKDSLLRNFLWGIISNPRLDTILSTIPQRGLQYSTEKDFEVVLVNYVKDEEQYVTFRDKRQCFIPSGSTTHAVKIPNHHKAPKYLLLHSDFGLLELYPITNDSTLLYSQTELSGMGFSPMHPGNYLVYDFEPTKINLPNYDLNKLLTYLGGSKMAPYFETIDPTVLQ